MKFFWFRAHGPLIVLLIFFLFGLILRMNGVSFGLPLELHPDEHAIIKPAIRMANDGNLDPRKYDRPDHVTIYLNAFSYKLASAVQCKFLHDCKTPGEQYNAHILWYHSFSRSISAFFSALTIVVMYFLLVEITGRKTCGLLAASIVAVLPSFITHAHFVTPESIFVFFILLVAFFSLRYLVTEELKYLLLALLMCALATAEKYPGLLSFSMILFSIVLVSWPNIKKTGAYILLAFTSFVGFLFLITPYLFISYHGTIESLKSESRSTHLGHAGLGWLGNMQYYVEQFVDNFGFLLLFFAVLGFIFLVLRIRSSDMMRRASLLAFFGGLYFAAISYLSLHWERWIIPTYITIIVFSTIGFFSLWDSIQKQKFAKIMLSMLIVMVLIISAVSLSVRGFYASVHFDFPDTRNVSREWIKQNMYNDSKWVWDAYTPFLPGCCGSAGAKKIEEYRSKGVQYIVVSSYIYDRFLSEPEHYKKFSGFYQNLFRNYKPYKVFASNDFIFSDNELLQIIEGIQYIKWLGNIDTYTTGPEIRIYDIS